MVFCGKPSKGCSACRARKIKCDQEKPACLRCIKTGRICPGYRDPLALTFRDESQDVIRKAHVRQDISTQKKKRQTPSDQAVSHKSTALIHLQADRASSSPSQDWNPTHQTLPVSVHLQAACYFYHNYVVFTTDYSPGYMDQLPMMSESNYGGALSATITAVGLAGLSNSNNAPDVMIVARQNYASALHLVNTALRDPIESKTDQTLVAVMLLGMYEIITCSNARNVDAWAKHIEGATALLKFRGPEQLQTKIGLKLFMLCRSQIFISCLQRESYVSQPITEWGIISAHDKTAAELPPHRLANIIARLSNLRASIKHRLITSPAAIIHSALSIEAELAEWQTTLPANWAYTSRPAAWDASNETYEDHYHVYQEIGIASMWNSYRCVRILCHEVTLAHLPPPRNNSPSSQFQATPTPHHLQRQTSLGIFRTLSSDICASVPFHLGHMPPPSSSSSSSSSSCSYTPSTIFPEPSEHNPTRALYGCFLLWPLYIAGSSEGASPALRKWVIGRLEFIRFSMGVRQAEALADVLRSRGLISEWFEDGDGHVDES